MRLPSAKEPVTADEILRQRDRILASQVFASSERLRDFLDYLITQSLGDERPRLKELAIGLAVFGRDESFDPRIDAIVRVEAGRLRAKLREYYEEEGRDDPVRIAIPKGRYVPTFAAQGPADGARPAERVNRTRHLPAIVALLVVLVTTAGVVTWRDRGSGAVAPSPSSVAVLPLRDWSDRREDYFSEAMTDALIARLSERQGLRVTSLGSVLKYRNTELRPVEIARQLGVSHIVEGTVLREAGLVRISASLIDAGTDDSLWTKTYERPMTNVLSLQRGIASEIGMQLVGELLATSEGTRAADGVEVVDPLAYEAFLKGRYWQNRLTAAGYNRGIRYFQEAIDRQPGYADAYAGLAACHCRLGGHGIEVVAPRVALPEALSLARTALELDGTLAEPNALLGIISFKYEWNASEAERYLRQALELNPSLFEAHLWHSQVLEGSGRQEQAVQEARLAHKLNPLSAAANLNLGWQLLQAGQTNDAEAHFDRLLEFDPEFWGGHWGKGHVHLANRMYSEAAAEFQRAVELDGGHTLPMASLGYPYGVAGERDRALAVIEELRALAAATYVSPVHIAMVYAGLGDRDAAFEWLDEAREARARSVAWLGVTREFDGLRGDPRWATLLGAV
ncbi:MAG: tetratricopeptide repeat protein, partial [Gammaproteobacteria bacterium]